jgi:putative SOS response-associated peptidase YedK
MCGRFSLISTVEEIISALGTDLHCTGVSLEPRYNVAPGASVFCGVSVEGAYRGGWLEWGVRPSWAKSRLINAKVEKFRSGKGYWNSWKPCFLPATGIYEWSADRKTQNIRRGDGVPLLLAGLWGRTEEGDARVVIVTESAAAWMQPIHHRMPVLLSHESCRHWCEQGLVLGRLDGSALEITEVGKYVNRVGNDGPECWESVIH